MDNYQKHKERTPEETVFVIQKILRDIGLFPVIKWTGVSRKGQFSNRITLYPTTAGVNGKGTDELYCTASGFGEMMERLQNNMLVSGSPRSGGVSFMEAPDEESIPLEDILKDPDPFTAHVLDELKNEDESSGAQAYYELFSHEVGGKEMLTVLPFADPVGKRVVKVPIYPTRRFTGTNGMSAGNTMEEAMVQGLSELFEREVHTMILEGKAVPPEIPDEVLQQYSFYHIIKNIKDSPQYRISLYDCSLGKGWPVVALCVHDLEKGTFGFNVGAHPSFPVAIERTLTESAQGKTLPVFTSMCRVDYGNSPACNANKVTIMNNGRGLYPASLFCRKPDWEFKPWTGFKGPGNKEYLHEMLQLLKKEGHTILVRDASFLGFPACYILVPGFQQTRDITGTFVRAISTTFNATRDGRNFPKYSDEEARRLMLLIRYYEQTNPFVAESVLGAPSADPRFSNSRLGAILALRLEEFSVAAHFLSSAIVEEPDVEERRYLNCLLQYARMRQVGMSGEEAHEVLRHTQKADLAERACKDTSDLSTILERLSEPLKCPDCTNCPMHGNGCDYKEQNEIFGKVRVAMKKENVSPEKLLKLLEELW